MGGMKRVCIKYVLYHILFGKDNVEYVGLSMTVYISER